MSTDQPMSNEQIYVMAREDWTSLIAQLWLAAGKPVDPERLAVYGKALATVPFGLLEQAISRTIRQHRFANVPTVGDVWDAVRAELGNPSDVSQAIAEWCELQGRNVVVDFSQPVATETEPA